MGSPSKTFTFEAITREQIKDYAEASTDWNKIHIDDSFAKEAGLPGIIAHGMLSMGLAARALEEWGYSTETLQEFDSKFKEKVLPGDVLKAELFESSPKQVVVRISNQRGEEILTSTAVFA